MKSVFLDFATLGPKDLDTTELLNELPGIDLHDYTTADNLCERIADAEVVMVNKIALDAPTLAGAKNLRIVCLAATGSDNIDIEAAAKHDIAVCNIRDYCTPSVVQHVFAMLLSLNQRLANYQTQVTAGLWESSRSFCLLEPAIRELHGKTLGLIGLGTLGGGVAGVARAFGMRVIASRLPWRSMAPASDDGQSAPRIALEKLLPQSDFVSLHCPLNNDTANIIDAETLSLMKPSAILINTARGGLVDSAALLDALRSGAIAGAGIDVLDQEPPGADDPLINANLSNLIVTPHMAWSGIEARQRALDEMLENLRAFERGEQRNRLV
jgi:glycerate dehydrogenase